MSYTIECIVTEITFDSSKNLSIKIKGTEGYLLKTNDAANNEQEFNILSESDGKQRNAIHLLATEPLPLANGIDDKYLDILKLQIASGRGKIRLKLIPNNEDSSKYEIQSITYVV